MTSLALPHVSRMMLIPERDELDPVLARLEQRGHPCCSADVGRVTAFVVPTLDLAVALGGHGKVQLGVQTQYVIDRLPGLRVVTCFGAAGGLARTSKVGDVVVATETVEHDYKLRFVSAPVPRHPSTPAIVGSIRASLRSGHPFQVVFGAVASGDEDVVDTERARQIALQTGALCVAWEGAGAARAAAFNGVAFVEIRCITDAADADAAASFRTHCARALPNGVDVVVDWLMLG